ncbi:MAG: 30S ribosomal protein S12 methylthiotransferase RimO [Pseudomonadota bacterium]
MTDTSKVGYLSLGCPKALVDSENIVTALADQGYNVVAAEEESNLLVINTCGFIEAAEEESFAAIEEALAQQREVVVTGCLGARADQLRQRFPQLRHISGPAQVTPVVDAVRTYQPLVQHPEALTIDTEQRTRLTPEHYAYVKISEGCNHKCTFCIIPSMRGPLVSRQIDAVLREIEQAVHAGAREILLIAQDLSAYGLDQRYALRPWAGEEIATRLGELCAAAGEIAPWVRLHYVYPYPHVDSVIPLMRDGLVLPYLDMPLQHASPTVLKAMRRPAAAQKSLERILRWREICPELAIRSTFIVGFPGETDDDVGQLLDFLEAAQLDRVGCFTYSAIDGAQANRLDGHVAEREKLDRQERVYETQGPISAARLDRLLGTTQRVLIDELEDAGRARGRTRFDAPDIDGEVYIDAAAGVKPGDFAWVAIERHDDHDLHGTLAGTRVALLD